MTKKLTLVLHWRTNLSPDVFPWSARMIRARQGELQGFGGISFSWLNCLSLYSMQFAFGAWIVFVDTWAYQGDKSSRAKMSMREYAWMTISGVPQYKSLCGLCALKSIKELMWLWSPGFTTRYHTLCRWIGPGDDALVARRWAYELSSVGQKNLMTAGQRCETKFLSYWVKIWRWWHVQEKWHRIL